MNVYEAKIYQGPLSQNVPYRFLAENWKEANIKLESFLKEAEKDVQKPDRLRTTSLEELFALDEMVLE